MADGFVQLAPDSTGKKADVNELTVGSNVVERQRVNISSPTDPNGHAEVMNEPPPNPDTTYALLVRQIQEDNAYTQELLGQIANTLALVAQQKTAGVNSVQVGNLTAANLVMTATQATAANLACTAAINQISGIVPTMLTTANPYGTASMEVALNSAFPLSIVPQHIYGGISV